jgi:hypothetical protein
VIANADLFIDQLVQTLITKVHIWLFARVMAIKQLLE